MDPSRDGLGEMHDVSVGFTDGELSYLGSSMHAPKAKEVIDGRGTIGLPGLVDPHTHSVWAGSRSNEFRRRLAGESYTRILEHGGGILSTVTATRDATKQALETLLRGRLARMCARGVTTVEVKSGYGLNPETEARMLGVARQVGASSGPRVTTTFLGAHTLPAEFRNNRDAYVRQIIDEQLPMCAPLADSVDVYCDRGAFSLDESTAILAAGQAHHLKVRAHAEQVEHTGIAAAAAQLGATCVDHLERLDDAGVASLAQYGTTAVLLPGAQLYLRDTPPPVEKLREAGVPMAVGSDLNPGSSPVHDLWACATLAAVLQGLTVEEALMGITRNAGRALGLDDVGWLGSGSVADLVLMRVPPGEPLEPASLIQNLGLADAAWVFRDGVPVCSPAKTA